MLESRAGTSPVGFISNLTIENIIDLSNNSLPNFTYSYKKNVCINTTTQQNNFNLSYICADPDGDTCYYGTQQIFGQEIVQKDDFDSGTWVTLPPTAFSTFSQAFSAQGYDAFTWVAEFANYLISLVHPARSVNTFINADQSLLDSGKFSSDCTIANNGISLSKLNGFEFQGFMLINNGCNSPMNITLPDYNYNVFQKTYSISFLLINLTQFGSDYHESLIRYKDSFRNNVFNLTIARNFTQRNTSFYVNGALVAKNTTNADLYRLRLFTNETAKTYLYIIQGSNGSMDGFNTLYISPVKNITWLNINYLNLWTFYGSGAAYDDIFLFGVREKFDWSTTFPISSSYITAGYSDYNIYVTDSAHKDYDQYNTYPITLAVSSQFCGQGLYTDENPPNTAEERGSPQGFFYLLSKIYGLGNALGAQAYFNAVGWLFYLILFMMVLWNTWELDVSMIVSSAAVFILGVTGMLSVGYLITSILLFALGITIRLWLNNGAANE